MSDLLNKLFSFLRELKRRNVYRVATVYAAVAFIALEVIDLLIPSTTLPGWADEFLLAIAIIGFPIAAVVAWAVESTPDGLRLTQPLDSEVPAEQGQQNARSIVIPLVLVIAAAVVWWFVAGEDDGENTATDRTIAVLPFEAIGADTADVFAEGMHLGVLTRLSSVANLDVISRTSVVAYRVTDKTLPQIAEELGASWVLRADVLESGGDVQVYARLIDARKDHQVWAQEYRRSLNAENVFEIQAELSRSIIDAMHAKLTSAEGRRVDQAPTDNLEAYRLTVLGRREIDRQTADSYRKAEEYFQMAIEIDPDFALAWEGLGNAILSPYVYGYDRDENRIDRAERHILHAIELDPEFAEAHASMYGPFYGRQEGPEALEQLRRALELNPNYANAHIWLSYQSAIQGHPEQAVESGKRGVALDPLSGEGVANLAIAYLTAGQYDLALTESRRVEEVLPSWPTGEMLEGVSLFHLSRYDEARTVLEGVSVAWTEAGAEAAYALSLIATGDPGSARDELTRIEKTGDLFSVGLVHAALGEKERAFEFFQQVDRWRDWSAIAIRNLYPQVLADIRADGRYERLLRDVDRSWGVVE